MTYFKSGLCLTALARRYFFYSFCLCTFACEYYLESLHHYRRLLDFQKISCLFRHAVFFFRRAYARLFGFAPDGSGSSSYIASSRSFKSSLSSRLSKTSISLAPLYGTAASALLRNVFAAADCLSRKRLIVDSADHLASEINYIFSHHGSGGQFAALLQNKI